MNTAIAAASWAAVALILLAVAGSVIHHARQPRRWRRAGRRETR
ncbi:MAG: hypothetical protein ACRD0W_09570 [Acidimicrobiales bacterium]